MNIPISSDCYTRFTLHYTDSLVHTVWVDSYQDGNSMLHKTDDSHGDFKRTSQENIVMESQV